MIIVFFFLNRDVNISQNNDRVFATMAQSSCRPVLFSHHTRSQVSCLNFLSFLQSKFDYASLLSSFQMWEEHPDVYGVRRSNRSRQEPSRLNIGAGVKAKKCITDAAGGSSVCDGSSVPRAPFQRRTPALVVFFLGGGVLKTSVDVFTGQQ